MMLKFIFSLTSPKSRQMTLISFLAVLVLVAGGCQASATNIPTTTLPPATETTQAQINKIVNPAEAISLINENEGSTGIVILDVRTADEYSSGHLQNALNIDIYQSDFRSRISQLSRTNKYLVYCRTGVRSAEAAAIMRDLGFTIIYNMDGGITEWIQAGNKVVK
jgi:rhodanese-related sulfurtransferase